MSEENRNPLTAGGYPLLDALRSSGLIDDEQRTQAQAHAQRNAINPRAALVELGMADDAELLRFLSIHTDYPTAPEGALDEALLDLIPADERLRYGVTPLRLDGDGRLHVAFCDPLWKKALRTAGKYAPGEVLPYISRHWTVEVDASQAADPQSEPIVLEQPEVQSEAVGAPLAVEYSALQIAPEVLGILEDEFVRRHRILPVRAEDGVLHVLMDPATSLLVLDDVRNLTRHEISIDYRDPAEIGALIETFYGEDSNLDALALEAGSDFEEDDEDEDEDEANISDSAIVKIVNGILRDSIIRDVSDIHVHPNEDRILVRFRIDGVLQTYQELPKSLLPAMIARIKVLSGLDIAKKRIPQDGRLRYRQAGRQMDFRVSTLPTVVGEKAVLRLLKGSDQLLKIPQLGFSQHNIERFVHSIEQPYGMFLVTGPTGSGKSFTLFSAMDHLNAPGVNICTIEDPVEYRLPGLAQVQTNNKAGLTFAAALRSFLRQDPDIIMVGEIRDEETARIATESALTGHLVLATLHTNDAAGAITRLAEMGVDRFNINASLLGVLAQRLARRVCRHCARPARPDPKLVKGLGVSDEMLEQSNYHIGAGCDECGGTGYRGRTGIHELLTMSPELEHAIGAGQPTDKLREIGRRTGMTTLREDAIAKALQGITTFDEVLRVTAD